MRRPTAGRSPALGKRIKEARQASGLSQSALAQAISLDRTAVSKIESDQRRVSSLELASIAQVLNRPVESFLAETAPLGDALTVVRGKRTAILRIARRHGARSIRIFGSAARGDATRESDIDFLVEMEPGRGLFEQAAMLLELEDLLGREVDVVTVEGLRDRIRERVLAEAIAV
ncbi:MAG TPA: nucleotidyltransferase domain-containing protein [Actinomycetota bacterium]